MSAAINTAGKAVLVIVALLLADFAVGMIRTGTPSTQLELVGGAVVGFCSAFFASAETDNNKAAFFHAVFICIVCANLATIVVPVGIKLAHPVHHDTYRR